MCSESIGQRRVSRAVRVGPVMIGGDAPVSIQTMTTADSGDVRAVLAEIDSVVEITPQRLCERDREIMRLLAVERQVVDMAPVSADIVRVSVPHRQAARALETIVAESPVPIVADIHFDHRLALLAIEAGVAKLRLNPGNITDDGLLRAIGQGCAQAGIAMRIGVNHGSIAPALSARFPDDDHAAMIASVQESIQRMRAAGLEDLVVSAKATSADQTVLLYRQLAARLDCPLHLGVTEAGLGPSAVINSLAGIGLLLQEGIGDTLRVSLTETPALEVVVGHLINSMARPGQ